MVKIFDEETLKEFEDLYEVIIPALNEWNNCNVLSCTCFVCKRRGCKNCERFRKSKWTLLKKCNARQWDYVINFSNDFFKVSDLSIEFFWDLKPLNEEVKYKNRFLVYK